MTQTASYAAPDRSVFFLLASLLPRDNGTDEGHEGRKCHDPNRIVCSSGGKSGPEVEGSESCHGKPPRRCGGANEKEWIFQARRRFEHEAQEQAGCEGTQGHPPVHQGAVCDQSEAGIQESDGQSHEKTEGFGQLKVALGSCR